MIIDTTETKIGQELGALADVQEQLRRYRNPTYDEFEWGGCSCHICPPCSYCVSHSNCALCDQVVLNDDMVEFNDNDWVCPDCAERDHP
ncbi:MAG: hypothetical protein ACXAC5_03345 [Promethearchaeota archaeon]|jgi:hypothetical protein